jgi:hypothetical protein
VDRDRRRARVLDHLRERRGVPLLVVPPRAHLDGHRNPHRLRHRRNHRGSVIRFAHQAAAGVVLGDLGHGASHVHIDDVGAHSLHNLRRGCHLVGLAPENLNRNRSLFFGVLRVLERSIDPANEALRTHHLGDDETAAAVTLDQTAECRVGHSRHRGDGKRRHEINGANLHFSSVRLYVRCVDFDADRLTDEIH